MKNVAIKQLNSIFSRMKGSFIDLLSIFDGNRYTTSDDEIILPIELTRNLQDLDARAKKFEKDGISALEQSTLSKENSKHLEQNQQKYNKQPRISEKQTQIIHSKINDTQKSIKDIEKDESR